jgi:hypothetical protein
MGYVRDVKLAVLVVLVACGGPPKRTMLTWGGANVHAKTALTISERGEVVHSVERGDGRRKQWSLTLTQAELQELVDILKTQNVCSLVRDGSYTPVPDESITKLVVDLPSLRCTVELWDREWDERAQEWSTAIRKVEIRAQDTR